MPYSRIDLSQNGHEHDKPEMLEEETLDKLGTHFFFPSKTELLEVLTQMTRSGKDVSFCLKEPDSFFRHISEAGEKHLNYLKL